jgi:hypothetical protein
LDNSKIPPLVPEGEITLQAERRKAFAVLWRLSEETPNATDPLTAVFERNTAKSGGGTDVSSEDRDGKWTQPGWRSPLDPESGTLF